MMMIIQIAAVPLLIGNLIAIQTACSTSLVYESTTTTIETATSLPQPHQNNNNNESKNSILSRTELFRAQNSIQETSAQNMLLIISDSSPSSGKTSRALLNKTNQAIYNVQSLHNNQNVSNNERNLHRRSPSSLSSSSSLLYSSEAYIQTSPDSIVESYMKADSGLMMNSVINKTENAAIVQNNNNNSEDTNDVVPPYMKHMTIILVILHMSVFITGLVGNSLVCLSVFRNKSLQTVTNYYIVNLAVADFLVILICLPPTVYWDLTLTWNFGLVLCKLVLYLQSISVSVSVLTLTCISIDRWYAICRPLEFSSTKYRAKITIVLIWIISMLIASPDVIFLTTRPLYEENNFVYMDCTYSWPENSTRMYQLCIVTLLFVVPFVLMSISYWHIVNVLWRNETMADSLQHSSYQLEEEQQFLKRKYESMSAMQEDGTPACEINQNSIDNKNKSTLAIVTTAANATAAATAAATATAAEVDYMVDRENNTFNSIKGKSNDNKSKINHETPKATKQSNDVATKHVDLDATSMVPSSKVADQRCKTILEKHLKEAQKAPYTYGTDHPKAAFQKQQDSNCYPQTTKAANTYTVSHNQLNWRPAHMLALNCKRKIVQRKLSAHEQASTRYPRESMPLATTNLNPSNKRRHSTIESYNHEHNVCCCCENNTRGCSLEHRASTFIECLVSSPLMPLHDSNLHSKSFSIESDGCCMRAAKSSLFHPTKLTIDLCALDHKISKNKNKVNNFATGLLGENTNSKFVEADLSGCVGEVAGEEASAIQLEADQRLALSQKSSKEAMIDDVENRGYKYQQNLVVDDDDGSKKMDQTTTSSQDKMGSIGQLKDKAQFNSGGLKEGEKVSSPDLTAGAAQQKTTACFRPTSFTKEVCSAVPKLVGNRHISKNICHEIRKFSDEKNSNPEKLISANIAGKKVRKNLATSLVVDMSFEVTGNSSGSGSGSGAAAAGGSGDKPRLVDYKELDNNSDSPDRNSSCIRCSVDDNKKHDCAEVEQQEEEHGVSSTLMTIATTTTNESSSNSKEARENLTLKSNCASPLNPLYCCVCLMDSLRKKSDKLKADKALKKYRKNLANYAANKERYRNTTNSSRITRQTMFTSSFLKGNQAKKCNVGKNLNYSQEGNQSSSNRFYLNVETSANTSKDVSTHREHRSNGNSNSRLATTPNDHSPSLASNNFNNQQQPLASYNSRFYKLIESRKKAAKMLIVIVIMFGLCYLPIHFLNTLRYTIGLPQNDITTIASLVSHWLCYFNSAINPLIYNLMSGKFRHEFANLFFCKCFRRNQS